MSSVICSLAITNFNVLEKTSEHKQTYSSYFILNATEFCGINNICLDGLQQHFYDQDNAAI